MFLQDTNEKTVLKDDVVLDAAPETAASESAPKDQTEAKDKEKKRSTGKRKKKIGYKLMQGRGQAHVQSTFNNTIVTITDQVGNAIVWASSGKCGFKGPKKSTPFAAGIVVKSLADQAKAAGVREVDCFVRGVGAGREAAVRALAANGIMVSSIKDLTAIPHNGCRPRKPRRI